mgnify:CR=1 FL=1
MIIRTPRLQLHPASIHDLDDWFALDSSPGVLRYLTAAKPSREQVEADLRKRLAIARLHHGYGWFSFRLDGQFVGRGSIRPSLGDDIFNPEIGIRLRPEVHGQGLGLEAMTALVEYGFTTLGISSVVAITMASNAASRRMLERIGLQEGSTSPLAPGPLPGWERGQVHYRMGLDAWLDRQDDVRQELHDLQAAALKRRDSAELDHLRTVGMKLAALESDGSWVSSSMVRHLASDVLPQKG